MSTILGMRDVAGEKEAGYEGGYSCFSSCWLALFDGSDHLTMT